ncbi:AdeC/AdeK/OprM family multidrug efflux complex outer membrane factor [Massilia pseudoviolaceinigra]|uniref:AdeC/AdeK/OprM family multidrug efflux complex outer membrane factor n=1 Tax=Massilia pseudoviolaceinigra TaxID=3057165 RepID=UPI002796BFC8|nr:AdeC/AdeK/OprM family multidrug efflux complex outer membrane factor [Massilia sp. CCM 9206]MDQ1923050.1 AdeC/AdeK/OprM family multidrug efflux complex outer membrane factor [Massilia sp. CCM 9206]
MNSSISPTLKLTVLAAVISGCTMMPKYQQPVSPVAAAWPTGTAYPAPAAAGAAAAADIAWRDYFADERLKKLIALALANNRDLRVSALNIDKARAQYRIERAAQLPSVAAGASQSGQRTADKMSAGGQGAVNRQYGVDLGVAAWEADLFGRVRSLSEAALQTYLGTEEARASVQISLVAEVANAYLTLMADQERLLLARQTLASQQRSLELSESRVKAGAAAGLDLYQDRTTVESARADAAAYTAQVAQGQNALTLLAGAAVPAELLPNAGLADVTALTAVSAGLPSDLLYRRPDVLAAERTLQASSANIGAARAAFFPRITLTGQAGTASSSLSGLFDGGSGVWSFAPSISLPIFDGGANRANLEVAKVNRDIGVAQYEKTIQAAFREVADALAQRGTVDERLNAQRQLVEASDKSYRIYEARYKNGADTFQNALIAQRALYAAQQGLISVRLAEQTSRVTLYKVLGGGWRAGDGVAVATQGQAGASR